MSRKKYVQGCSGCRPMMLDLNTNNPLPDTHPAMIAVNAAYDDLSESEREAWHRFTCLNGRDAACMMVCKKMHAAIGSAMEPKS